MLLLHRLQICSLWHCWNCWRRKLRNLGATVRLLHRGGSSSLAQVGDLKLSLGFFLAASTCCFLQWDAAWASWNLPTGPDSHQSADDTWNIPLVFESIWIPCGGFLGFLLLYSIILLLFKVIIVLIVFFWKTNASWILCGLCVFKIIESL